jgi:hypothetical protein
MLHSEFYNDFYDQFEEDEYNDESQEGFQNSDFKEKRDSQYYMDKLRELRDKINGQRDEKKRTVVNEIVNELKNEVKNEVNNELKNEVKNELKNENKNQEIIHPLISQPENLNVKLYLHQLASVYKMEEIEKEKKISWEGTTYFTDIAINADMTGYGKTISMVALVLRDKMHWDIKENHVIEKVSSYCSHHIKRVSIERYRRLSTTLVLAGPSIVYQWEKEFSNTPLRILTITKKKLVHVNPNDYDVIIVCNTMFNLFIRNYGDYIWKRLIFDEPTIVKVPNMLPARAGFTWLVSATPREIYYRHKNCRGFMSEIINRDFHYLLDKLLVKNTDEFIYQSFTMPKTNHINYHCYDPIFRAIYGIVDNRISHMIEAGNISGAISALGGKKTDNLLELVKTNKNIELEEIRSKIKIWTLRADEEKIKEWTEREKSVVSSIKEIDNRFGQILQNDCTICMEKLDKPVMEPNCQNIFCGTCLLTWLDKKGSCPLCRKAVNKKELTYIKSQNEEEDNFKENKEGKKKTKEDTIIEIINSKKDGRFIIFSDYDSSFSRIREVLNDNDIDFIEISGASYVRNTRLEMFRNGKVKVAFLNSQMDSAGINMVETTDIIIYHSMTEGIKTQIIGRANRIGRTQPLFVHNLISQ